MTMSRMVLRDATLGKGMAYGATVGLAPPELIAA